MAQRFFHTKDPCGSLKIEETEGMETIWAEPMILGEITKDTILYANPPLCKKKEYEKVTDDDQVYYVPRAKAAKLFDKDISLKLIPTKHLLKKGTQVLFRDAFAYDPQTKKKSISPVAVEIATFEQKDAENDLPESGRGVEIKQRGYLFKTHVQLTKEEYYYKTKDSIFPDKLSTSAVKQTVLGDCFLLSAVVSILSATGCEYFFRSMMRQNKETGLTYVRLYNPNTNKPVCLVVRNDIFCEKNDDSMQHQQLWIHMLEKAYAGYGMSLEGNVFFYHHSSFRAIYGSGGISQAAFQILTGQKANLFALDTVDQDDLQPFSDDFMMHAMLCAKRQPENKKPLHNMVSFYKEHQQVQELFNYKFVEVHLLISLVQILLFKHPDKCGSLADIFTDLGKLGHRARLADINKLVLFLNGLKTNEFKNESKLVNDHLDKLIDLVSNYIQKSKRYTADALSGSHTTNAIDHFNTIKDSLLQHCLITAGTLTQFPEKVPGLRNRHAYAVLDVKIEHFDGKDHYFIKLRNPWGRVGRVYSVDLNEDKDSRYSVEDENLAHAEFWLDLNDFCKYFRRYFICNPVPGLTLDNTIVAHKMDNTSNTSNTSSSTSTFKKT